MSNSFLFIDIETTGLNPHTDRILEIYGTYVTDDFVPTHDFHHIVDEGSPKMDEVVSQMHTKNNLLKECQEVGVSFRDVDDLFKYDIPLNKQIILAGSGVHFDRKFLEIHFPWIVDRLHYRLFDLRSLSYVTPPDLQPVLPFPKDLHRAKPDTLNAVCTAKYYQNMLVSLSPKMSCSKQP